MPTKLRPAGSPYLHTLTHSTPYPIPHMGRMPGGGTHIKGTWMFAVSVGMYIFTDFGITEGA